MLLISVGTNTSYLSPAPLAFRLTPTIKTTKSRGPCQEEPACVFKSWAPVCAYHMLLDLGCASLLLEILISMPSIWELFSWKEQVRS